MKNHFVEFCYTTSKYIYIKFNRPMTLTGPHSILNTKNYLLSGLIITNNCSTVCLSNLTCEIYSFGDDFVSFKYKNINISLLDATIQCGYIDKENIYFITDVADIIHDFSCSTLITTHNSSTSLEFCTASLYESKNLTLKNNNLIKYHKLIPSDFYIKNENTSYSPYEIKEETSDTYIFKFKSDIIRKASESLYLCTTQTCKSTDALGITISTDECLNIENFLPTTPISLSIFSYVDDILGIALDFSNEIKRYDSNDFYFSIKGKRYNAKGRERYIKGNIIYFFIYDLYDFDCYSTPVSITYKNPKKPYTLDKNLKAIQMTTKLTSNTLYGISGILDTTSTNKFNIAILDIEFSNYLLEDNFDTFGKLSLWKDLKKGLFLPTILNHSEYLSSIEDTLLTFYINDLVLILLHTPLNIISASEFDDTYNVKVSLTEKRCVAEMDNFLSSIHDTIEYIEVIPLHKIKSHNYTLPITSIEIPLTLIASDSESIICDPTNQGNSWTLLGQTVVLPTTLLVNKVYQTFNYGSLGKKTIFQDSLYIKNTDTKKIFDTATINFINLKGETLYISLDDAYSFNFDTCEFENTIIL
ncbi:hypothetical protein [uncultured Clostridium sp.]|uniref:hypothetical protein n=1 Tax=uncultured Clostridium sp. TaxID=59620 RepID=UPI002616E3D3|nr:hypothetical protein [uncultured Clostridium sp.]